MKKAMDKLLDNVKFDKRYVLFCMVLVILGIITGALFIIILNDADKSIVTEYIKSFMESLINNDNNYLNIFYNNLIINVSVILILAIIGFTYFLVPINVLILFYKAFVIGFSLSSFILTYKIKGLVFSIFYIFPHLIINILLFCLLTAFTLKLSINMIKHIVKGKSVNLRGYLNKYIYVLILFILTIGITTSYESFVLPTVLKAIIKIIL